MIKWHKGPPPSIGWWPASHHEDDSILRWWNGEYWSVGVKSPCDIHLALIFTHIEAPFQRSIRWINKRFTWPERSRT
jgi:hypothetical protein